MFTDLFFNSRPCFCGAKGGWIPPTYILTLKPWPFETVEDPAMLESEETGAILTFIGGFNIRLPVKG